MDFELSDEQAMLRDATRGVLRDRAGIETVRAELGAVGGPHAERLWRLGAELGWTGLALPEEHGGSEQGLAELAIVAEEFGRAAARGAVVTSALVGTAVARGGPAALRDEVLPGLAAGTTRATWAFAESGRPWTLAGVTATARAEAGGYVLDGVKTLVEDAPAADLLLVTALLDGVPTNFLVDAADVTVSPQTLLDLTRSFGTVRLDQVRVPAGRRLGGDAAGIQRLLDDAAVLASAEALGVMERLLEMTVSYTAVREQFGRPIGSFQAVKHGAADMAIAIQGSRAAVYQAAMAADAGVPGAATAASVAASHVSAVLPKVAGEALQLHGGIGFTWEHDLHLYLRRAKADEVLQGDAAVHRERLCALLGAVPQPA
ncbi:MAG TPA: acyl-CoA dehydrogenase family protein [Amycolatopsis sp.]|nr:acyl-CoA dehydrogenase family protein [Amycolatopsis sp.]